MNCDQDLPIAALVADSSGVIFSSAVNRVQRDRDATSHAEICAIRSLAEMTRPSKNTGLLMVVTLEPCPMCAWAIKASGFDVLVFGAYNASYGAAGSVYDLLRDTRTGKRVEVFGGVLEDTCRALIGEAFSNIRNTKLG